MKKIKIVLLVIMILTGCVLLTGCSNSQQKQDIQNTLGIGDKLAKAQPTPQDIDYSLERYNLIRRAYWVNGQREQANTLVCSVDKPLGYIALFLENGSCVGKFIVDGKVSSLNSYLTPDSMYFEKYIGNGEDKYQNKWLPDVDGSYGENDKGIFFFDVNGNYVEWTGTYLYTDIPMQIKDPVVKYEVNYDR